MGKVLLTIGYVSILLPDERGVSTIMATLSRGAMVHERLFAGEIEMQSGGMEVGMKMVPPNVRYLDEKKMPITVDLPGEKKARAAAKPSKSTPKKIGQSCLPGYEGRLFLGNGKGTR